ncbi:MAG: laccase domain-containing protein, partial [Sheuella sp.]|nr:laccase domain-containing protein [Sheuella sp.]
NKWLADLAGLAVWRLKQSGVEHVENSGLCTVSDQENRFFSYRRDHQTGRMATLAWLGERN